MVKKTRKEKNLIRSGGLVLIVIYKYMKHFGKHSIYPAQTTLLSWLKRFHGYDIGRRWLNYLLRAMEDADMILRQSRNEYDSKNGHKFRSTRYYIGPAGWVLLGRLFIVPYWKVKVMISAIKNSRLRLFHRGKESVTPEYFYKFLPELYPKPPGSDG